MNEVVTKEEVKAAIESLELTANNASATKIRKHIKHGSNQTIQKFLVELREESNIYNNEENTDIKVNKEIYKAIYNIVASDIYKDKNFLQNKFNVLQESNKSLTNDIEELIKENEELIKENEELKAEKMTYDLKVKNAEAEVLKVKKDTENQILILTKQIEAFNNTIKIISEERAEYKILALNNNK